MLKATKSFRFIVVSIALVLITSTFAVIGQDVAERVNTKNPIKQETKVELGEWVATGEVEGTFTGPDVASSNNYVFATNTSGTFTDMTGSTQLVGAAADDTAGAVTPIGFEFWLNGVRYTQFNATSNGMVALSSTGTGATGTTYGFATAGSATTPLIAAMGGDLQTATGTGKVHYKLTGAAPNRVLTVEFLNMGIVYNNLTPDGTFQVRLYETTGQIEFVYGSMSRGPLTGAGVGNGGNLGIGFSVAAANGSLVSIVSATDAVTTTTPFTQQAYATGPIANLDSPTEGSRKVYSLTPPVPAAPTALNFTGVTGSAMTLNWTDVATNEAGYVIYRSTDGVNYSFLTQTAENIALFNDTGLTPGTNYFYRVYAASEGALSSVLAGSQMTSAPGNDTCNGAGGDWSNTATWTDGSVPTATDNVTIGTGCTVTVDVTTAVALSVMIDSGGTLQSPTTGAVINNNLTVGGDVTNNGTLDFSTNGDTSAAILTFGAGAANVTFGGTGATTDVRAITVAKGAQATVVDLTVSNFTVQGVNTDVAGYLTLTSGTFKISGTFTMVNRTFGVAGYTIPLAGGFWLNNPNYEVAAQAGNAVNNGLFRLSNGTFNQGTLISHSFRGGAGALFTIEGGILNCAAQFSPQSAVIYNQSAGTVNVGLVGNSQSNFATFELFSTTATFTMSGGTINIVQASTGATQIDYQNRAVSTVTGGTVNIGTAATVTKFTYNIRGTLPNLVIDNTTNNKTATATAQVNLRGTTLINPGTSLTINGQVCLVIGPTFTNNGTLIGTTASTRFYFLGGSGATTYNGSGTVTAPLTAFEVDNVAGVTIDPAVNQIITSRFNNFAGGLTGSGKLTIGNGAATTGVIQLGVAGPTNPLTGFDVPPVFNPGTGGMINIYAQELTPRTTGNELIPSRTLTTLSVSNTNNLTIAGGDITVNNGTGTGAGAIALTAGRVITGSNTLYFNPNTPATATVTRTTGYVDGNFRKAFDAAGAKTFEVGTANGYSPVAVNMTAATFPANFNVRAVQGPQPNIPNPALALSRYWSLSGDMGVTADLTFNYLDPTDIPGTATEGDFVIQKYDGAFTQPGGAVNAGANSATITGVTSFSDWTLAAPGALVGVDADLSITKDDGVTQYVAGGTVTYTITASNAGPSGVTGGSVVDTFPAQVASVSWTCSGAGGGTCTAAGVGDINDTVNLPSGGSVTYIATATISAMASGPMANTATVAGGAVTDPNPGNNSATDTDTLAATSVQFSSATYIEDESQNASIVITRTGDTTGISSVLFSAAAGGGGVTGGATCAAGVDFILVTNQLVTFIAGDDEETVSVVICGGDTVQEVGENIALTLSTPTNAGLGTPAAAVLSINDTASQFLQIPPHTPIDLFLGAIANPYPSTITVAGGPMLIGTMRVTLYDVSHAFPDNMDVLLVGPNGQKYLLLADTGGNTAIPTTGHVTLTFSDFSMVHVPDSAPWTTGQYLPTVCDTNTVFAPGAPPLPYVTPNCTTANSIPQSMFGAPGTGFGLTDSNGVWSLYVRDDAGQARPIGDAANFAIGTIAGGWGLEFLAPTAADASISGSVLTGQGRGIRGAIVTVTGNSLVTPINVQTGVNGRYTVPGLTAGETYVVTVASRRFFFEAPSRVITLNDNVTDADFTAASGTTREQ